MQDDASGSYRLSCLADALQQLRELAQQAHEQGRATEFRAALQLVNERLTSDPQTWGDPMYRYPSLGLLVCQIICPPLHVLYGVNEAHRTVFVKRATLLPPPPEARE